MSLRFGILGFLSYGKMTGYDIAKAFESSVENFWHATTSQIYRELDTLETDGFAASELVVQADRPNKRVYSATPAGIQAFREWLCAPSLPQEPGIKSVFLMKLFFSDERPVAETVRMLEDYRNGCMRLLQDIGGRDKNMASFTGRFPERKDSVYWKLTRNFGSAQLAMCITWAQNSIETLNKLSTGANKQAE